MKVFTYPLMIVAIIVWCWLIIDNGIHYQGLRAGIDIPLERAQQAQDIDPMLDELVSIQQFTGMLMRFPDNQKSTDLTVFNANLSNMISSLTLASSPTSDVNQQEVLSSARHAIGDLKSPTFQLVQVRVFRPGFFWRLGLLFLVILLLSRRHQDSS